MSPDGVHGDGDHQETLALPHRLRLLIDLYTVEHGVEPRYSDVAASLKERGISLSRARWSYMLNGHREVHDPELLAGLADYFGVSRDFVLRDGPLPERVKAQLHLIRAMRVSRVRSFAARTLGDVSPRALNAITQFLDDEASGRNREG